MKKFYASLLLLGMAPSCFAQQWWAPGACWVNEGTSFGPTIQRTHCHYDYDTLVDIGLAQVVHCNIQFIYPWGVETSPQFTTLFHMQEEVVYAKCTGFMCSPAAAWDTAFYLGVPGDRWRLDDIDPNCYPYGALEIQDTGHVIIQGITLRTWDLAYLDSTGLPLPNLSPSLGDTLALIERFGMLPATPPQPCDGSIIDYFFMYRIHYSDADIAFPDGSSCDLATGIASAHDRGPLAIGPNPGTDVIVLSGSSGPASIEVRDMFGRLVLVQQYTDWSSPIATNTWPSGAYWLTVILNDGSREVLRWVKQ